MGKDAQFELGRLMHGVIRPIELLVVIITDLSFRASFQEKFHCRGPIGSSSMHGKFTGRVYSTIGGGTDGERCAV